MVEMLAQGRYVEKVAQVESNYELETSHTNAWRHVPGHRQEYNINTHSAVIIDRNDVITNLGDEIFSFQRIGRRLVLGYPG